MTPDEKTSLVKSLAAALGFDRVGVTPARPLDRAAYYKQWLQRGHAGAMRYLHRNVDLRCDPAQILPSAKSIICTAVSYKRPGPDAAATDQPTGHVSSYARGRDYHVVLRGMLEALRAEMHRTIDTPFESRAFVDTGPLIERELAAAAGLGWIGKNTMLMHERLGSFLFLGEIVTTLELAPDAPATDHCGTCTRCLDACPTDAFPAPHQLDASRCLSYLTIEHRGDVPLELARQAGDWIYGCDVCQDVCPFNTKAPLGRNAELAAERIPARVPLVPLTTLTSGDYRRLTDGTAARRASRQMWQRNAATALSNVQ